MKLSRAWLAALVMLAASAGTGALMVVLHDPQPALSASLLGRAPDLDDGAYVAALGDWGACHTLEGGKTLAGGLAFATPVGAVYATNITPDDETGIGRYSLKDFIRLMRFGIAMDGRRVYPAMPYTAYTKATDEDLQDLFAFLKQKIAPVRQENREADIGWPLSVRWPLAFWNLMFLDTDRFRADSTQSAAWNRGAYIVQGFAHCGTCHTPRGIFFQEKDTSGRTADFLAGASLDGSSPINLRGNAANGLGRWSVASVAEALKTGRNARAAVNGPMTAVVAHSTQYFTKDDANAIALYIKSLLPSPEGQSSFASSDATYKAIMAGESNDAGMRIYMDSCAACHRLDGQGYDHAFPRLAGNATVLADNTESLIAIILRGDRLPSTASTPSRLAMPPFGWRYGDEDIAKLATFLRTSWGNHATGVTAQQIASMRNALNLEAAQR